MRLPAVFQKYRAAAFSSSEFRLMKSLGLLYGHPMRLSLRYGGFILSILLGICIVLFLIPYFIDLEDQRTRLFRLLEKKFSIHASSTRSDLQTLPKLQIDLGSLQGTIQTKSQDSTTTFLFDRTKLQIDPQAIFQRIFRVRLFAEEGWMDLRDPKVYQSLIRSVERELSKSTIQITPKSQGLIKELVSLVKSLQKEDREKNPEVSIDEILSKTKIPHFQKAELKEVHLKNLRLRSTTPWLSRAKLENLTLTFDSSKWKASIILSSEEASPFTKIIEQCLWSYPPCKRESIDLWADKEGITLQSWRCSDLEIFSSGELTWSGDLRLSFNGKQASYSSSGIHCGAKIMHLPKDPVKIR